MEFQRENALLKVGYNRVEGVDEVFAVGDALFQLLTGGLGFLAHGRSVAQVAHGGQCLTAAFIVAVSPGAGRMRLAVVTWLRGPQALAGGT